MWLRATRPRGGKANKDALSVSLVRASDRGLHVRLLEILVFQRHRQRAIKHEEHADAKFAAQAAGNHAPSSCRR